MSIFDRRLVVVTGKGGVGRTTTSAALALAARRAGKRVCIVELNGLSGVARLFGLPDRSYAPRPVADGVDTVSLTAEDCLDDFGHRKLKVGALVRMLFRNRVMGAFLDAVPGLPDLLQLGKLENMLMEPLPGDPRYDLAVLDAPATGHGLTLLAAARSMADMTRVGPFHDLARIIEAFLSDPEIAAVALTTLPEELPVNEGLELVADLHEERARVALAMVNRVEARLLPTEPPWDAVRPAVRALPHRGAEALVALTDDLHARQTLQDAAIARLRRGLPRVAGDDVPVVELPRLGAGRLAAADVERLGASLYDQIVEAS